MGSCGKPPRLCKCKKKGKKRITYVGRPKPTPPGHEHGRKKDGLEKKPRTPLPVGIRFM